jgi:hypothetical protein
MDASPLVQNHSRTTFRLTFAIGLCNRNAAITCGEKGVSSPANMPRVINTYVHFWMQINCLKTHYCRCFKCLNSAVQQRSGLLKTSTVVLVTWPRKIRLSLMLCLSSSTVWRFDLPCLKKKRGWKNVTNTPLWINSVLKQVAFKDWTQNLLP